MNIFIKNNRLVSKKNIAEIKELENIIIKENSDSQILWIDLFCPSVEEVALITKLYKIEVPTKEEREEIEESARYWEDSSSITINTYFLIRPNINTLSNQTVTFILCDNILFTIRYGEFKVFDEIQQRVLATPKNFEDGFDLMSKIFEMRVEKDADLLEDTGKETRALRKSVFANTSIRQMEHDEILEKVSTLQELNMSVRDTLFDKRRGIAALIRSDKIDIDIKKNLTIVLKDLNSLVEYTSVNMNALDNIQNILTNQINIEQNKTIKFFTVVTVAMMPPTLIGTIYGMNFKFMPELEFAYAYPVVLCVMALSMICPIIYFKKKGWLG